MRNFLPAFATTRRIINWLPLAAFSVTLVLMPARIRWTVWPRPLPPIYRDYTDWLIFAPDLAMILTLALWMLSLLVSPRRLSLGPRHIWIPLAGLTITGWLSSRASIDPSLSAYHAFRLTALFLFFIFIVNEIHSAVWVLIPIGLQVITESAVALAQFIAQRSVGLQNLGELPLNPSQLGISVVIANGGRLLRAYGLSDHPNILGGCLAFGLVLLLVAYLNPAARTASLFVFLVGLPALLVTFSRSAWLAFLTSAFLLGLFLLIQRRWAPMRSLLWLGLTGLLLVAPFLLADRQFFGVRLNAGNSFDSPSAEQQSIGERVLLIRYAEPLIQQHPWTGVGLGASPLAFHSAYPDFPVPYEPPHLALFDALLETGIPGFAFYLALLAAPIVVVLRKRELLLDNPSILAAFLLLLSLTVVGFFDYYTWLLVPGRLWLWLAWGLWGAALTHGSASIPQSTPLSA